MESKPFFVVFVGEIRPIQISGKIQSDRNLSEKNKTKEGSLSVGLYMS